MGARRGNLYEGDTHVPKRWHTRTLAWKVSPEDDPPDMSLTARIEAGCLLRRLQFRAHFTPSRTQERNDLCPCGYLSFVHDGPTEWCLAYRLTDRHVVISGLFPIDPAGRLDDLDTAEWSLRMLTSKPFERGWHAGDIDEFLQLTEAQVCLIDIRVALADKICDLRNERLRLTQTELARVIGSSQSRVAAMETPAAGVSLDLLIKSILGLGVDRAELARVIAGRDRTCA
jgi:hypothetical protein